MWTFASSEVDIVSYCCPVLDSRWLVGMKVRRGREASRNCSVSVRTLPCPALNASSRGDRSSNQQPCPPQPISQKTKTKRSSRSKVAHAGQEEHPPTKIRTTRQDPRAPAAAATTLPKTTTTTTTFELPCVLACLSPLSPGRVPARCMPLTQGRAVGWMRKTAADHPLPPPPSSNRRDRLNQEVEVAPAVVLEVADEVGEELAFDRLGSRNSSGSQATAWVRTVMFVPLSPPYLPLLLVSDPSSLPPRANRILLCQQP